MSFHPFLECELCTRWPVEFLSIFYLLQSKAWLCSEREVNLAKVIINMIDLVTDEKQIVSPARLPC